MAFISATVLIAYLSLVVGELTPKRLAIQHSERFALVLATPLDFIAKLTSPFIWLLSHSSDALLRIVGGDPQAGKEQISEESREETEEKAEADPVFPDFKNNYTPVNQEVSFDMPAFRLYAAQGEWWEITKEETGKYYRFLEDQNYAPGLFKFTIRQENKMNWTFDGKPDQEFRLKSFYPIQSPDQKVRAFVFDLISSAQDSPVIPCLLVTYKNGMRDLVFNFRNENPKIRRYVRKAESTLYDVKIGQEVFDR